MCVRKGDTIKLSNRRAKVDEYELAPVIIIWGHFLAFKHLFQKARALIFKKAVYTNVKSMLDRSQSRYLGDLKHDSYYLG